MKTNYHGMTLYTFDDDIDGVEEEHDGEAGIDGGEARRPVGGEVAHHPGIHHVVKLLEQVARHDGQGKEDDLFEDGTAGQIPVILRPQGAFFLCHSPRCFL